VVGVTTTHLRRPTGRRQSRLAVLGRLALWTHLLVGQEAVADSVAPYLPADRILVNKREHVLELSWSDTEERLQGNIQPDIPLNGEPFQVLLNVGSFQGAAFEGPLTVTLREAGVTHGQTVTVKRPPGAVNWRAEFTAQEAGHYQLDVSFRTTRLKVIHAEFDVGTRPVPRPVLWVMVGLLVTVSVGYGIRLVVKKDPPAAPPASAPQKPSPP
jgi:hypothetical protein